MLPCRTPFDTLKKVDYVPPQLMHICWLAYQKDNNHANNILGGSPITKFRRQYTMVETVKDLAGI